eukprot:321594-Chlamydomonas_euryale.AAC.1
MPTGAGLHPPVWALHGHAIRWLIFDVVQGRDMTAKVRCEQCNDEITLAIPSNLASSHFDSNQRCNKPRKKEDKIEALILYRSVAVHPTSDPYNMPSTCSEMLMKDMAGQGPYIKCKWTAE